MTFKIKAITARLFDRQGNPMNTGFEIKPSAVSNCLDGTLKIEGWSPWRLGQLAKATILEPGENTLGCVCLKPGDRSRTGFVKLKVDYTPFPKKLEQIEVGPSGTRTFKSYVLGLASKTGNVFQTATQRPCCDGMR